MSVEIDVVYTGNLHCEAVHGPSGESFWTDAPVDNQGKGESFSPTDLVATAMGTCMLTIMAIAARTHEIDMNGSSITVSKEMIADPHRRIAKLATTITVPGRFDDRQKQILEKAALGCPVHRSLDPRVEKPVEFVWVNAD